MPIPVPGGQVFEPDDLALLRRAFALAADGDGACGRAGDARPVRRFMPAASATSPQFASPQKQTHEARRNFR